MPELIWECGPHMNAWNGHDARCRQVSAPEQRACDEAFGYPGDEPHPSHDWDASVQDRQGAPWHDETFTCPGVAEVVTPPVPSTPEEGRTND